MSKRKYYDKYLNICICLCLCMALFSFLPYIIVGNGAFTLMTDFNAQQIPFSIAANDAIKNGQFGWLWNADLGTNLIGAFSFYNLGSPFFWCSLLFPAEAFPYVVGWLFIFKYVVAGALSYLYIRRFVEARQWAVLGAVLYAFSGFQCVNLMFYHFHDVVAFFPLLLLGIEKLVVDNKKGYFVFCVFINCIINYFFFCGEVLFLILYFLFRFGINKKNLRKIIIGCIEGIIGIGMAGILFVPSLIFIMDNPKASTSVFTTGRAFYSLDRYLEIFKGILFPGEPMYNQAVIGVEDFTSTSAYLPGIGITFVLAYMLKEHNWIKKLMIASLLISLFPLANSIFYSFSQDYRRWWYMPVLIMALASAEVLDKLEEYKVSLAVKLSGGVLIAYAVIIGVLYKLGKVEIYSVSTCLCMFIFVILCNIMIMVFQKKKNLRGKMIWILVVLTATASTSWNIYQYRIPSDSTQDLLAKWKADRTLKNYDINYRYDTDNSGAYIGGVHPLRTYNSTITGSIFVMHNSLGLSRTPAVVLLDVPGVTQLLGGKYYLTDELDETGEVIDTVEYGDKVKYIMVQNACPIGFTYDRYILKSEFEQLDTTLRGCAALRGLVIEDDLQNEVAELLEKIDITTIDKNALQTLDEDVKKNNDNMVEIYEMNANGFKAETMQKKDTYAFFSVPYESGWSVYINGQPGNIIKVHGMMAIQLEEGNNQIEFKYAIPGGYMGIVLSIVFTVIWILYIILLKGIDKVEVCKELK